MPQTREVSENHNDYEYSVVQDETGRVRGFRKLIDSKSKDRKRVRYNDLPSESLKGAFQAYTGLSDRELNS